MGRVLIVAFVSGLAGFVALPAVVFLLVLGSAHLPGGRCGAPGESGRCETGAFAAATASAMPGFGLFFLVPVAREFIRRRRSQGAPEP